MMQIIKSLFHKEETQEIERTWIFKGEAFKRVVEMYPVIMEYESYDGFILINKDFYIRLSHVIDNKGNHYVVTKKRDDLECKVKGLYRYKSKLNLEDSKFFILANKFELEYPKDFIHKDCCVFDIEGYSVHIAHIDDDMYLAEIEFDSEEAAMAFKLSKIMFHYYDYFGDEVTSDPKYRMMEYYKRRQKSGAK